jgi:UDP-N-acetylmuramate dehydrogenase
MNAGAFGCEISSALSFATLYDPVARSVFVASPAELDFGYRKSAVSERRLIVVSASFVLASGDRDKIAKRMRDVVRRRAESQPLGYPSAGCVFKRSPDCRSAGALIESVGMKGRRIGDAAVSERHANFIVNTGQATARDFLALAEEVRRAVKDTHGVQLDYEIELLGDFI